MNDNLRPIDIARAQAYASIEVGRTYWRDHNMSLLTHYFVTRYIRFLDQNLKVKANA